MDRKKSPYHGTESYRNPAQTRWEAGPSGSPWDFHYGLLEEASVEARRHVGGEVWDHARKDGDVKDVPASSVMSFEGPRGGRVGPGDSAASFGAGFEGLAADGSPRNRDSHC